MAEQAIVADLGSEYCRFGWCGSSLPDLVFKTADRQAGGDSLAAAAAPSPIQRGVVQDWDGVEAIISSALEELQVRQ